MVNCPACGRMLCYNGNEYQCYNSDCPYSWPITDEEKADEFYFNIWGFYPNRDSREKDKEVKN